MENASKALIIAGAILISIVLITFGVMILGQGSEVIKTSDMSETEVSTFNAKFTSFQGTKVRGSKVNSLINTVIQNNMSQDDPGKKVKICDSNENDVVIATTVTNMEHRADTGHTYNVSCHYNNNTGLIDYILVKGLKTDYK